MIVRILYHYYKTKLLKHVLTTREKLRAHQEKQFKKLIRGALSTSPFYQEFLDKPFHEWPIINKSIMMEQFDRINTGGLTKEYAMGVALKSEKTRDFSPLINDIAVGLSSGTSGQRGLFLVSPQERDAWAGAMLAKLLPQGLRKKERIAFFLRANNKLYTTLSESKRIQFHFFDLLADFDEHIKRLNDLQPTILSAPASVLLMLARQKKLAIQPEKIVSVAEVLEKKDEAIIAETFNCSVSQVYQCTEGFLAISDRKSNQLVMNEEFLIIEKEWVDEQRFIPIITDLLRTTQPIIRYRLDDVLLTSSYDGVFTALSAIEGRVGDICYAQQGKNKVPIFADLIRQQMASSPIDFEDYLITQEAINRFTISIFPEPANPDILINHLNQLFRQKNCTPPDWHWLTYIPRVIGAKCRRIQCMLQ